MSKDFIIESSVEYTEREVLRCESNITPPPTPPPKTLVYEYDKFFYYIYKVFKAVREKSSVRMGVNGIEKKKYRP